MNGVALGWNHQDIMLAGGRMIPEAMIIIRMEMLLGDTLSLAAC